jgi:hypothetical protein
MHNVCSGDRGNGEGFERGFLGIVEPFFGIGEGKIRGKSSAGAY